MNSTLTRVQAFAIVALCVLLVFGGIVLIQLQKISDDAPSASYANGIETSWRSASGAHRLWSLNDGATTADWLDGHIAAFIEAEKLLPPIERSK